MAGHVISVQPDDSLRAAARIMAQHRLSGVPVIDKVGVLVGVLTEGDLIRWHEGLSERQAGRIERFGEGYQVGPSLIETIVHENHLVKSVMSRDVVSAPETISAQDAAAMMARHHVKRLPVMRGGTVVGIVSRSDLVRALANEIDNRRPPQGVMTIDEALRRGREEALRQVHTIK
jgi:CBS domain-containing protein